MRLPVRSLLAGTLSLVLLGLGACSDDDPGPSASDPTSDSTSASATPSESTSGEPTESESASETPSSGSTAYPGVTPAGGPEMVLDTISVRLPEDWTVDDQTISGQLISGGGKGGRVILIEQAGASDVPLDVRADIFLQGQFEDTTTERLDNVMLGAPPIEAARFQWTEKGNNQIQQAVLSWRNGYSITFNFELSPALLKAKPDLVESMLASITWVV